MNRTAAVVGMHFNRRFSAFWMPPILGLGVVAIMIVVVATLGAAGIPASSPEVIDGFRDWRIPASNQRPRSLRTSHKRQVDVRQVRL